jgi:hypothetical protein
VYLLLLLLLLLFAPVTALTHVGQCIPQQCKLCCPCCCWWLCCDVCHACQLLYCCCCLQLQEVWQAGVVEWNTSVAAAV